MDEPTVIAPRNTNRVPVEKHPMKTRIDNALAKGDSYRSIAAWTDPPIHFTTLAAYAKRLATGLKRVNQVARVLQENGLVDQNGKPNGEGTELIKSTNAALNASPFLARVEELYRLTLDGVKDAKGSVRTVREKNAAGEWEEVPVGRDFMAFAAMLNQAHKNAELFGRGTGALDAPGQTVNQAVVVLLPDQGGRAPQIQAAEVIDVTPVERSNR